MSKQELAKFSTDLAQVIDQIAETKGARILITDREGKFRILRDSKSKIEVCIIPRTKPDDPSLGQRIGKFWDRWGDAVLSCTAAGFTMAASAGCTAVTSGACGPVAWVAASASATSCGLSVGKAIEHDFWRKVEEVEQAGGHAGIASVFNDAETVINLIDLMGGVKGLSDFARALGDRKNIKHANNLKRALKRSQTGKEGLTKLVQQIDPSFRPNFKGVNKIRYTGVTAKARQLLKSSAVVNLKPLDQQRIYSAIAGFLTAINDSPGTVADSISILILKPRKYLD